MKFFYSFCICILFTAQFSYAQVQPLPATPPPASPPPPVLLQMGGLPDIGVSLNQDYNCVGLNPANLGLVNKGAPVITFGLAGLSGGVITNAVNLSTLEKFFSDSLNYRQALSQGFTNKGISVGLNIMDFGASVQIPKIGGFAFTVDDRILLNIYMNPLMADIGFQGLNYSNYFGRIIQDSAGKNIGIATSPQQVANAFYGSYVKGSYTRTYALSYGRSILSINDNISLCAGGSLDYVVGYGYADGYSNSSGMNASLSYSSSFSQLGDSNAHFNPLSIQKAGSGVGLDLGGTLLINKNIQVSASVTDLTLSSITWGGVVDVVQNSKVDSLHIYQDPGSFFKSGVGSTVVLTHPASFTAALPTQLHLGGSMFLISKFVVAADIDVPLNSVGGNLEQPVTTLYGGYCPSGGFRVTLGFQNSAYAPLTIPLGIVVGAGNNGVWQWGVSYADLLNFFRTNTLALGGSFFFLRFRV